MFRRIAFVLAAVLAGLQFTTPPAHAKKLGEWGNDRFKIKATASIPAATSATPEKAGVYKVPTSCCAGNHTGVTGHPAHQPNSITHHWWTELEIEASWSRQIKWTWHELGKVGSKPVGDKYYPGVSGTKPTQQDVDNAKPSAAGKTLLFWNVYLGRAAGIVGDGGDDKITVDATQSNGQTCAGDYCLTRWPCNATKSDHGKVSCVKTEKIQECTHWRGLFTVAEEWTSHSGMRWKTTPDIHVATWTLHIERTIAGIKCGGMGYNEPVQFDIIYWHDEGWTSGLTLPVKGAWVSLSPDALSNAWRFPPASDGPLVALLPQTVVCGTTCSN